MTPFRLASTWPRLRRAFGSVRARGALGSLVAGVIALQGVSVSAAMARGPVHVHTAPAPASVVLLDVRRGGFERVAPAATGLLATFLGHHHDQPGRHFHAADDASVVVSAADQRVDDANGQSGQSGHSLDLVVAAFIAVVASTLLWLATAALPHGRASHTAWQPSRGVERRLDRPPQTR